MNNTDLSKRSSRSSRNVVVHGYLDVDMTMVADILRNRLDDLLSFVATIRLDLAGHGQREP